MNGMRWTTGIGIAVGGVGGAIAAVVYLVVWVGIMAM